MTRELLKIVAQAFENADFEPLYKAISDDVLWKSSATEKGFFRVGGEYRGRRGVARLIRELETNYTIKAFIPKEIISSGDVTWGLFWVDLIYKPAAPLGRVTFDFAIRWQLRDGKIVEHQAFMDTAALLVRQKEPII
jgi:ketosteroid isomerase-like protein